MRERRFYIERPIRMYATTRSPEFCIGKLHLHFRFGGPWQWGFVRYQVPPQHIYLLGVISFSWSWA